MCLMRASSGYPTGKPSWQRGQLRMSEPTVSISSCRETVTPLRVGLTPQPALSRDPQQGGLQHSEGPGYPCSSTTLDIHYSHQPTPSALPRAQVLESVNENHCPVSWGTPGKRETKTSTCLQSRRGTADLKHWTTANKVQPPSNFLSGSGIYSGPSRWQGVAMALRKLIISVK